MIFTIPLSIVILLLLETSFIHAKTPKKPASPSVRIIKEHRSVLVDNRTPKLLVFKFVVSNKGDNSIVFNAELKLDPSNLKYNGKLLPEQPEQPKTAKSPAAPPGTPQVPLELADTISEKIRIYKCNSLTPTDSTKYTFERIKPTSNMFTIDNIHGMIYVIFYCQSKEPSFYASVNPILVDLDAKYKSKDLNKDDSSAGKIKINLDRVDSIVDKLLSKQSTDIPSDCMSVGFLVYDEGHIFQDNTYSYIIIVVLLGLDGVFVIYYFVMLKKKRKLNDLIAKNEATEPSKLDVTENEEKTDKITEMTEQSVTEMRTSD